MLGLTRKPSVFSHSSTSECVAGAPPPSCQPSWYQNASSGRAAVIFGSSWRTEPAAELRGLAKSGRPASPRSTFSFSKPLFVM